MKKGHLLIVIGIGILIVSVLGIWFGLKSPAARVYYADVVESLSHHDESSQFEHAIAVREFQFPSDFGPHPSFQTEWWYYTGNLVDVTGRHFGYQLTIFRRALDNKPLPAGSKWRTNQVYFAHFAVTDVAQNRFYSFERFSRGAMGLAGSQASPYRVWLEDWQVFQDKGEFNLSASEKNVELHLILKSEKPIVLQGDRGLSRKGQKTGNASYYFSQTRLATHGMIKIETDEYEVTGYSWLDREWSTSALQKGESGWDWFAIQLDDNREVMLYQIRTTQGVSSAYSAGTYIDQSGASYPLSRQEFSIKPIADWKSPHTGVIYPAGWIVEIPTYQLALTITPYLNDQEHRHSFIYWEGAVQVKSSEAEGDGYVELTGYDKALSRGR